MAVEGWIAIGVSIVAQVATWAYLIGVQGKSTQENARDIARIEGKLNGVPSKVATLEAEVAGLRRWRHDEIGPVVTSNAVRLAVLEDKDRRKTE